MVWVGSEAQKESRKKATAASPWHNRKKEPVIRVEEPPDLRLFCGHCQARQETHNGEYIEHVKGCLEAHRRELYDKNWVSRPDTTYPYPRLIIREPVDMYQMAQNRNGFIRRTMVGLGK